MGKEKQFQVAQSQHKAPREYQATMDEPLHSNPSGNKKKRKKPNLLPLEEGGPDPGEDNPDDDNSND